MTMARPPSCLVVMYVLLLMICLILGFMILRPTTTTITTSTSENALLHHDTMVFAEVKEEATTKLNQQQQQQRLSFLDTKSPKRGGGKMTGHIIHPFTSTAITTTKDDSSPRIIKIYKVNNNDDDTTKTKTTTNTNTTTTTEGGEFSLWLNMTLCQNHCEGNCMSYSTPLGTCFNPGTFFPKNDSSWGEWDILDQLIHTSSIITTTTTSTTSSSSKKKKKLQFFRRTIFSHSSNSTCTSEKGQPNDVFEIPLMECVGPFDQPRPWGSFVVILHNDTSSSVS